MYAAGHFHSSMRASSMPETSQTRLWRMGSVCSSRICRVRTRESTAESPTTMAATMPLTRRRFRWKPASSCCAASAYPPAVSPPPTVLYTPKKAELSNPDSKNRLAFQQGGFLLFNYRYFRIPSVAVSTSPLMVTVNLMLFRSPNTSSQLRNFSVSASTSAPTVLHRLSMNT